MRIPMTSFDALLALEENKNPKKKLPLMAHQKRRTSLVHVILLKPLPLPNNYDSRKKFSQLAKYVREGPWKIFRTASNRSGRPIRPISLLLNSQRTLPSLDSCAMILEINIIHKLKLPTALPRTNSSAYTAWSFRSNLYIRTSNHHLIPSWFLCSRKCSERKKIPRFQKF